MYNYRLNQDMDDVKAIYFDGTPFGINRIKDFIQADSLCGYIDDVRTILSPTADESSWADSIKGCIAEVTFNPDAGVDYPNPVARVYPGDMLIVKHYPSTDSMHYRLRIVTMPMTAFSAMYQAMEE